MRKDRPERPFSSVFPFQSRCACLGFLIAGAIASHARAQQWAALGPAPISGVQYTGRVAVVACSPTDSNRYFIGAADGGVWRTGDGGLSWIPVTDSMPTTSIGAIAIDPTNSSVVYVGSGEANFANHSRYGLGIYKSVDGGDSWTLLAGPTFAGRCISKLVVDRINPQTVYASVTIAGGFPTMAAARGHPQAAGPLGVLKSADGGVTWAQLAGGLPGLSATDLAIDPVDTQTLYAAIGHIFGSADNGVYKTVNGGTTWTRLAGGLPTASLGRISLGVAPTNRMRVYALIANAADAAGNGASTLGAWRTDNGGTTWTSLPVGSFQATYGWYLSYVSVQPTNADVVFVGGLNILRSTNAGVSWSNVTAPHVDNHGNAWDAAGRFVVGDDGGVHRTANLGTNWSPLNAGVGVIQFYAGFSTHPTDANVMIGGTQDNGTNRRSSAGTWQQVFGGDGGWTQINQVNPLIVFAESQGTGSLGRSTDGGFSFGGSSSGIIGSDRNCFLPPYLVDPANPNRMLYATHRVYESINGGVTWAPISGDLTGGSGAIRALAIAPSDSDFVYAATNDGRVQMSTDGGHVFQLIAAGVPGWPRTTREIAVHPQIPTEVYLAVSNFGTDQVRRTTDGGQTWEPLDGDLPDVPVNTVAVEVRGAATVLYAGADDGVYRTVDGGATWTRLGCGLPRVPVIDMSVEPARNRVVIATQGRGAWMCPLTAPADWNMDLVVNSADFFEFLNSFFAGAADFNRSGGTDSQDFFDFVNAFFATCG